MRLVNDETRLFSRYHAEIAFAIAPKTSLTTEVGLRMDLELQSTLLAIGGLFIPLQTTMENRASAVLDRLKAALSP